MGSGVFDKIVVFVKAQFSAFIGGMTDYLLMILLTELLNLHYTVSIVFSGIIGAVVNFSINRNWTFYSKNIQYESSTGWQLFKFTCTVANSILLKSCGTYLITTYLGIDYKISRIITDLIISLVFNYTLQKRWVFRKRSCR